MTACVYNALCYISGKEVAIKSFRRSAYFATEDNNGEVILILIFRNPSKNNLNSLRK